MLARTCSRSTWSRCCALLLFTWVCASNAAPDARAAKVNFVIEGTVENVLDGDTLTLRGPGGGRFHLRLSDLDAPETAHARNPYRERRGCKRSPAGAPAQPHAEAARAALAALAPRKSALRAECYVIDRYGRPVCHVFAGQTNLNLTLLRDGHAMLIDRRRWIRDPASTAAESAARAAHRGLWAQPAPTPPDDWRQRCWCRAQCGSP